MPGSCVALPADLQKESEVDRLVQEISSREKALHVLVNNAGATWGTAIDDYPDVCPLQPRYIMTISPVL
jgi:NAD(P)-dependent dehydrogenase (short-subunit alcohol dehydrogenase family)